MSKLGRTALIGAAVLALGAAGCAQQPAYDAQSSMMEEYQEYQEPSLESVVLGEEMELLAGDIVDVQTHVISFGDYQGESSFGISESYSYVIVQVGTEMSAFIYPYSAGIRLGLVESIKYRGLPDGSISRNDFVEIFYRQAYDFGGGKYSIPTLPPLPADGIILPDGIDYLD